MDWKLETDTETEKIWFNPERTYRITWRSKFMGVSVTPKYVGCFQYENEGKLCWDLISRHNKLGPAQKSCQRHFRKMKKLAKDPPKKKRQRRNVKRGAFFTKDTKGC